MKDIKSQKWLNNDKRGQIEGLERKKRTKLFKKGLIFRLKAMKKEKLEQLKEIKDLYLSYH